MQCGVACLASICEYYGKKYLSVSGMFHLCNILKFVVNCLYNRPLLSKSLSDILMIEPFMLLFSFVMSCIPSTKSRLNRFLLIYPLSPTSLPYMKSTNALYSIGLRSSMSPGVIMKLSNSPFSLHIRWSLKLKNHPIEHLPLCAMPLNVL